MIIHTDQAPKAIGPYSQAVEANGFVFASGQVALSPVDGSVVGSDIRTQTEQACQNIGAILDAAGLSFADVIKTTCYLADMADFTVFNEVYARYFISKPARSCVAVRTLPKNLLCEIEIVANANKKPA